MVRAEEARSALVNATCYAVFFVAAVMGGAPPVEEWWWLVGEDGKLGGSVSNERNKGVRF